MRTRVEWHFSLSCALVALGLLVSLLAVANPALAQGERIIFLHHSCGSNLIMEGGVRQGLTARGYEFYDHGYNEEGLVLADGTWPGTNFDVPGDNTDPDGYASIFTQPLHDPPDNTLSHLMQYDVIAFKSCFPVSNIESDAQLAEYQSHYLSIRDRMDQHPEKMFVIVTQPPEVPANSSPDAAARARAFVNWLQSDEYLAGHPSIFVFDFFGLLTDGDNFLRPEYRMDEYDAHPNELANRTIGPLFVDFLDQAIRTCGGGASHPVAQPTTPSEVVETPVISAETPPPVGAVGTSVIDDFEGYGPGEGWDAWTDGGETTMECRPDNQIAHGGTFSLLMEYDIASEGWAGCGLSYDSQQNWSDGDGLSMWLRAEEPDQQLAITLHVGDLQEPTPFQAELTTAPRSVGGWVEVELPWERFAKPDWHGPGGTPEFDPSQVTGVSFDFSAPGGSRREGTLWVDDLSLSVKGQVRTIFPVVAVDEPEEEGDGGICPFSTLSLPLVGVALAYWRRSRAG